MDERTITIQTGGLSDAVLADAEALAASRGGRPLSFAELREYVAAAERWGDAVRGGRGDPGDQNGLLPREVRAGDATLYSPTIASALALERVKGWVDSGAYPEGDLLEWTTAYALAHGCSEAGLRRMATPGATELAVRKWALSLTCTTEALQAAIASLSDGAYPPAEGGARPFAGATGRGSSAASPNGPGERPGTGSTRCP
jgi:hypothetical protein